MNKIQTTCRLLRGDCRERAQTSCRQSSRNWFAAHARGRDGIRLDIIDLADVDLPVAETRPGGCVTSPIADRLATADAYVVVTPEYNHGYPAAVKNAIDWHYREWQFKPVAFVSYGAVRWNPCHRAATSGLRRAVSGHNTVAITAPWNFMTETGFLRVGENIDLAAGATLDEVIWWATALRAGRRNHPHVA